MNNDTIQSNNKLDEAIIYAVNQHSGQFRKGTSRPYILHPLEVLCILNLMRADTNLQIAGVLHDTIEDTGATTEEIERLFGKDVAALVTAHSEDKSKTWLERKTHAIEELTIADKRIKMLVMADKVSNLRSMAADYKQVGEALWNRFNAKAPMQAWFYYGGLAALISLKDEPQCSAVYNEMQALCNEIFASYVDNYIQK